MRIQRKKWHVPALIAVLVVCVFFCALFSVLRFYRALRQDEYELQKRSLATVARLEASIIETKLIDYINTLAAMAELLDMGELGLPGQMQHLKNMLSQSGFHRLGVVTPEGVLHSTAGDVDVSDRDYFQSILKGESFVTGTITSRIDGERCIVIAVPAYAPDGSLVGAVHGVVLLELFMPYINTSLGSGHSSAFVFDKDGNYIVKAGESATTGAENIFSHLRQAEGGMSLEEISAAVAAEGEAITEVASGEVTLLGCFMQLSNTEWYALVATPVEDIEAAISGVMDADFYWMLGLVMGSLGILSAVVLTWNWLSGKRELRREAEIREQLLSKVVGFMVVDMAEDKILSRSGRGVLREDEHLISYSEYTKNIINRGAHPEHKKQLLQFFAKERILAEFTQGAEMRTLEFLFSYMPGAEYAWLECESHVDVEKGTGRLIVSHILRDINSRKEDELLLRREAERDPLTGLYNRSAAEKLIGHYLSLSLGQEAHAFALLDLDNFKQLNDTLGHQVGDKALKDVAGIISAHFRKDDVVCRLGGDEFMVLLKGISAATAREKLSALLQKLHLAYEGGGRRVELMASAGLAFYPANGTTFEQLYHNADLALYRAKAAGKGAFKEY